MYQNKADSAFDQFHRLDAGEQRKDRELCAGGKQVGQGDLDGPGKEGVKQEGDQGLSAAAHSEIAGVLIGIHRHEECADPDQVCGKAADLWRGVVDPWKQAGDEKHHKAGEHADHDREESQAGCRPAHGRHTAAAKLLADDDADGHAHGDERDVEDIGDRLGDVKGGNNRQAAERIILDQGSLASGPEGFVEEQRKSFFYTVHRKASRHGQAAVSAPDKREALCVGMGVDDDEGKLHDTGDVCGDGCTDDAQSRGTELSEDQDVVARQVDQDGDHAGPHGDDGLTAGFQGGGIDLGQGKGNDAQKDHIQVIPGKAHRCLHAADTAVLMKIQRDQLRAEALEYKHSNGSDQERGIQLQTEGVADPLVVALAVKLRGKNADTGQAAQKAQVYDQHQLVDHGDAAHGICAHRAHHHVVQHIDKAGDAVLYHDRDGDHHRVFVESFSFFSPEGHGCYFFLHLFMWS